MVVVIVKSTFTLPGLANTHIKQHSNNLQIHPKKKKIPEGISPNFMAAED